MRPLADGWNRFLQKAHLSFFLFVTVIKSVTNLAMPPALGDFAEMVREPKAHGEAHFVVPGVGPSFASQSPPTRVRAGVPRVDSDAEPGAQPGCRGRGRASAAGEGARQRRLLVEIPASG